MMFGAEAHIRNAILSIVHNYLHEVSFISPFTRWGNWRCYKVKHCLAPQLFLILLYQNDSCFWLPYLPNHQPLINYEILIVVCFYYSSLLSPFPMWLPSATSLISLAPLQSDCSCRLYLYEFLLDRTLLSSVWTPTPIPYSSPDISAVLLLCHTFLSTRTTHSVSHSFWISPCSICPFSSRLLQPKSPTFLFVWFLHGLHVGHCFWPLILVQVALLCIFSRCLVLLLIQNLLFCFRLCLSFIILIRFTLFQKFNVSSVHSFFKKCLQII